MWWLGLYMGDGSIERRRPDGKPGRVQLAVFEEHEPVLHRTAAAAAAILFGKAPTPSAVCGMRISSRRLAEYLLANGLGGDAHTKRIPEWVYSTPLDERMSFLAGYVDADGTVSKEADLSLTSSSPDLIEDARRLARACGLGATARTSFRGVDPWKGNKTFTGYRFGITGDTRRLHCRDPLKRDRLAMRRFYQTQNGVKRAVFGAQTSYWLGFAQVTGTRDCGRDDTVAIALTSSSSLLADSLVVRVP
jgi:hypothetical protein